MACFEAITLHDKYVLSSIYISCGPPPQISSLQMTLSWRFNKTKYDPAFNVNLIIEATTCPPTSECEICPRYSTSSWWRCTAPTWVTSTHCHAWHADRLPCSCLRVPTSPTCITQYLYSQSILSTIEEQGKQASSVLLLDSATDFRQYPLFRSRCCVFFALKILMTELSEINRLGITDVGCNLS